jgi:4-amino-4-deoxy-L-arabinose transferase-like glycosyltransferase
MKINSNDGNRTSPNDNTIGKTFTRLTFYHLIGLFVLAVILRSIYLKLASDFLGFDKLSTSPEDASFYLMVSNHFFTYQKLGAYGMLRAGPGFALTLAAIRLIFGTNLIWPILFNIVLGGLAPVVVYLLALRLLSSRAVALIAGLFSAVSMTSITLSCHILTDQPFFTLYATVLLLFVLGYQTGRIRWYVLAGLIAGYAAYIRPMGQICPYVLLFLALVLPRRNQNQTRLQFIRKAAITGLVGLVMVLGWSARNYALYNLFVFGTNGIQTVRSCLVAQVAADTRREGKRLVEYRHKWEEEDGDRSGDFAVAYKKAKDRIIHEFEIHPRMMLSDYFLNVRVNMTAETGYARVEIPQIKGVWTHFILWMRNWLGYVLIGLTLLGLAVMIRNRAYAAAWILGVTYFSFSIVVGVSIWQGSRLHYPAEMAWTILIAYLLVQMATGVRHLWTRLSHRQ